MNSKNLKENKIFIIGATAFLSGALTLSLDKLNNKNFFVIILIYLITIFIYIIATIRLSLTFSLIIALLTSIVLFNFSTEAAINLLEMAFLGSFTADFVKKDIHPKIGIPFISLILTILALVEIKFSADKTYSLLVKTFGWYLPGFLFLVSNLVTYIVYYLAWVYIKKDDSIFENFFYSRKLSLLTIVIFILVYIFKFHKLIHAFITNIFLVCVSFLILEGINFSLIFVKKSKSFFLKIAFVLILAVFPYLFFFVGFFNNLFELHKKILRGGERK